MKERIDDYEQRKQTIEKQCLKKLKRDEILIVVFTFVGIISIAWCGVSWAVENPDIYSRLFMIIVVSIFTSLYLHIVKKIIATTSLLSPMKYEMEVKNKIAELSVEMKVIPLWIDDDHYPKIGFIHIDTDAVQRVKKHVKRALNEDAVLYINLGSCKSSKGVMEWLSGDGMYESKRCCVLTTHTADTEMNIHVEQYNNEKE